MNIRVKPLVSLVEGLSFVRRRKRNEKGRSPLCFWNVAATGDYSIDCDTGQQLALEYLAYQEASDGPSILQQIVADMPRDLTGIEVAFLDLVGMQAKAGKGRARQIVTYWQRCAAAEAA